MGMFSFSAIVHARKRQCYYLTILSGKISILILDKLNHQKTLTLRLSTIIGLSYYHIGNYSGAQIWLKRALQMIKEGLKDEYFLELREVRLRACFYIPLNKWSNVFCYGYITKDFLSLLFAQIKEDIYNSQQPAPKKQPAAETVILSTETGVTEEKHSFVWSQFNHYVHKFQCAIDKRISRAEIFLSQVDKNMYVKLLIIFVLIIILVYKVSMRICIYLLSFFYTRQQSLHCFKFTVIVSTISMLLFVLGLHVFY